MTVLIVFIVMQLLISLPLIMANLTYSIKDIHKNAHVILAYLFPIFGILYLVSYINSTYDVNMKLEDE